MKEEISALQAKGAITVVRDVSKKGFYSSMFLVLQKGGKLRQVMDLRELNRVIKTALFQDGGCAIHEGLVTAIRLAISQGCILRSTNTHRSPAVPAVQVTGHKLPINMPQHSFKTKLFNPVMSYVRGKGIRSVIYIDDMARTEE